MLAAVAVPCTLPCGLQNGAAADEANAGDQPLDDPRLIFIVHLTGRRAPQHIAATGHGHQRKRAQTDAVRLFLAIPSDRQR